jgi:hypothetical protein
MLLCYHTTTSSITAAAAAAAAAECTHAHKSVYMMLHATALTPAAVSAAVARAPVPEERTARATLEPTCCGDRLLLLLFLLLLLAPGPQGTQCTT